MNETINADSLPEASLDIFVWLWWLLVRAVWKIDLNPNIGADEMKAYLVAHEPRFASLNFEWQRDMKEWLVNAVAASAFARSERLSSADLLRGDRVHLGAVGDGPIRFFNAIVGAASRPAFVEFVSQQLAVAGGFLKWVHHMRRGTGALEDLTQIDSQRSLKGTENDLLRHSLPLLSRALAKWEQSASFLAMPLLAPATAVTPVYMEWLQAHPDAVDRIAWEAFERVISEVFRSYGFVVDITARTRGRSADIIACHTAGPGLSTKFLIECKRYGRHRRIGLAAVNAVVGACARANADHAILVTTTSFSRDVMRNRVALRNLRLHLKDGEDVRQWLRDYRANPAQGFRLEDETVDHPLGERRASAARQ